tara:strand:+ start:981 stop:1598 length:618 start_codon:yes stop_codon:yes gene_type:complete
MKILELFAGSRSFSKAAEEIGHETYTTDFKPFDKIDQVCDIFDFDISKIPFQPDIIWASPPCTYFSVASIGHHWNKDHTPKTKEAILGVKIVQRTLDIIKELNPGRFYIENPRGKLRKLPVIQSVPIRRTVWYCKYGDTRAKPTDIWTNDLFWIPRDVCHNGNKNCHHEAAPRGSKTGTQGLKGNYERSVVPKELCLEILEGTLF